jgi:hypothetical protein
LNQGSHSIIVDWKKPSSNSDCVTKYIIEWVNNLSGSKDTSSVSSDEFSYTIKDLDACVEYAVSVTAVNADDKGAEAVTGKERTETAGNYHTHIILLCVNAVAHKGKVIVLCLLVLFCLHVSKIKHN